MSELTELVIMPSEDYVNACEAIRVKTGKSDLIKSGDMAQEIESIKTEPILQEKIATENGEVVADEGYDGLSKVSVDIAAVDQLQGLIDGTIEEFIFPEGTKTIRAGLFQDCSKLASVDMPDSITTIDDYAFKGCSSLSLDSLPVGLTTIGTGAFFDAENLSITELPTSLTMISLQALRSTGISISYIPDGVTTIYGNTFQYCKKISELTIHSGVKIIYTHAFSDCTGLTTVVIEGAPNLNSGYTFNNCTALTTVSFYDTPDAISSTCFTNCPALTTINVPWSEGEVAKAPWGATNATINYNYVPPTEEEEV